MDAEAFRARLTPEDLADIVAGRVSIGHLRSAAESMARRLAVSSQHSAL